MAFLSALMGVNNVHHFSEAYPGAEDCTGNDMQSAISEWFNLYYDKGDYKQEESVSEDSLRRCFKAL